MKGVSSGWKSVDQHYRVVPGELTVVTGVPNSGKSEWVDALMCNLAVQHGWTFALCSMENKVHEARSISHWSPYDPVRVVNAYP